MTQFPIQKEENLIKVDYNAPDAVVIKTLLLNITEEDLTPGEKEYQLQSLLNLLQRTYSSVSLDPKCWFKSSDQDAALRFFMRHPNRPFIARDVRENIDDSFICYWTVESVEKLLYCLSKQGLLARNGKVYTYKEET